MAQLAYNGCSFFDDCLTCPLPRCRYDMRPKQALAAYQMWQVVNLTENGMKAEDVARQLGMSRRTVFRHLQRARRGIYQ
jgi:DNA-binding NarL/FixJ family response regulator